MTLRTLCEAKPPWVYIDVVSSEDAGKLHSFFYATDYCSPIVRTLRGNKMQSVQGLMDEFGAALQFFPGFGENWNALAECLCYMDEWLPGEAYVLVITSPEFVLIQENDTELKWFLTTLSEVGDWWSKSILDNDRYNREAVPFHVILQVSGSSEALATERFPGIPILPR